MADVCAKCKGLLTLWIDDRAIRVQADGDVTVLVSRMRRTETYDGEFTQEERNPTVTATLVVPVDMEVRALQELCDVPIGVELCDGRMFAAEGASNVSDAPYDAKRNLQPIQLIMSEITEMLPQAQGTTVGTVGAAA